jgi:hypothetical protein
MKPLPVFVPVTVTWQSSGGSGGLGVGDELSRLLDEPLAGSGVLHPASRVERATRAAIALAVGLAGTLIQRWHRRGVARLGRRQSVRTLGPAGCTNPRRRDTGRGTTARVRCGSCRSRSGWSARPVEDQAYRESTPAVLRVWSRRLRSIRRTATALPEARPVAAQLWPDPRPVLVAAAAEVACAHFGDDVMHEETHVP